MRKMKLWLAHAFIMTIAVVLSQSTQAKAAISPAMQSSANDLIAEVNAFGIVLAALLFAGMLTWISSRRTA